MHRRFFHFAEGRWLKHSLLSGSPFFLQTIFIWSVFIAYRAAGYNVYVAYLLCAGACLYLLITHWIEWGTIKTGKHDFTSWPLNWHQHIIHSPRHIAVSSYDHKYSHTHFLLHQIHLNICSGDSVTPATSDVITPLPYWLSLWLSNRLHQCALCSVGALHG